VTPNCKPKRERKRRTRQEQQGRGRVRLLGVPNPQNGREVGEVGLQREVPVGSEGKSKAGVMSKGVINTIGPTREMLQ